MGSMATLVADASATNLCHKYKLILKEVVCEGHLRNTFCPQNSNELVLGISSFITTRQKLQDAYL